VNPGSDAAIRRRIGQEVQARAITRLWLAHDAGPEGLEFALREFSYSMPTRHQLAALWHLPPAELVLALFHRKLIHLRQLGERKPRKRKSPIDEA